MPAGPSAKTELVALQVAQIEVLRRVAGAHHAAPAGGDLLENRAADLGVGKQAALQRAFLDRAIDIAEADRLAELYPRIEVFEHVAGLFAGFRGALDRDLIADGVGEDAEPAFDLGEVLVVMPEEQRGVAIVVEGQSDLGGRLRGDRRRACPRVSATIANDPMISSLYLFDAGLLPSEARQGAQTTNSRPPRRSRPAPGSR